MKNELQFDQYDKRFAWAVENEQEEVVVALAFARLLYPYRLAEDAKEQYEGYLKSHVENVRVSFEEKRYETSHILCGTLY